MKVEEVNTCYECGCSIPDHEHFCDEDCRGSYAKRVKRVMQKGTQQVVRTMLSRHTKLRKTMGLPRFKVEEGEGL
jgi:predicted nucleic acid-binding Zn ribbon protein